MKTLLETDFGHFDLKRWPDDSSQNLQAWDAADEYMLSHVYQLLTKDPPALSQKARILIINDSFGALTCALHQFELVNWSDSLISHQCAQKNRSRNGLDSKLVCISSMELPKGHFDLVLIKVPKSIAFLEQQLGRLSAVLDPQCLFVAAGMLKYLPKSAFEAFERFVGPLSTSLARKKSRLILVEPKAQLNTLPGAYPTIYTDQSLGLTLSNHANVFSRERLDSGARFLLSQFDLLPASKQAIDLGCGNGILGIVLQQRQPSCSVRFIDESYMAVASARENHAHAFSGQSPAPDASFTAGSDLSEFEDESSDLILCNPPFHQQHVVGIGIAFTLFESAKLALKQHGELWVVANRHLGYDKTLNSLFGNCRTVAANKKFTVYRVIKR